MTYMEDVFIENTDLISGDLRKEGLIVSRYLTKSDPPEELVALYCTANQVLFLSTHNKDPDRYHLHLILQYPFLLPFIDAFSSIFRPRGLIRKKILVMLSILETSPEFSELFRPLAFSRFRFIFTLMIMALSTVAKSLIGLCLMLLLPRKK